MSVRLYADKGQCLMTKIVKTLVIALELFQTTKLHLKYSNILEHQKSYQVNTVCPKSMKQLFMIENYWNECLKCNYLFSDFPPLLCTNNEIPKALIESCDDFHLAYKHHCIEIVDAVIDLNFGR